MLLWFLTFFKCSCFTCPVFFNEIREVIGFIYRKVSYFRSSERSEACAYPEKCTKISYQAPYISSFRASHPKGDFRQLTYGDLKGVDRNWAWVDFYFFTFPGFFIYPLTVDSNGRIVGRYLQNVSYEIISGCLYHF